MKHRTPFRLVPGAMLLALSANACIQPQSEAVALVGVPGLVNEHVSAATDGGRTVALAWAGSSEATGTNIFASVSDDGGKSFSPAVRCVAGEMPIDPLEPGQRRPAVGIQIHQDVARGRQPPGFARDDQAFARLVDDTDVRNLLRHGARLIGARIVDDEDLIRRPRLGQQGMQTSGEICRFIMGADNDAHSIPSTALGITRHACVAHCRGIPTCIHPQTRGPG